MTKNITLIGCKSAGKSTIAKQYAQHSPGYSYLDTDNLILESGDFNNIYELYKTIGNSEFRRIEANIIANIATKNLHQDRNYIIASGGGVVLDAKNVLNIKSFSKIIFLDTPLESIITRVKSSQRRSFLTDSTLNLESRITEIYNQRRALYLAASDHTVDTASKSTSEIILEIQSALNINFDIDILL